MEYMESNIGPPVNTYHNTNDRWNFYYHLPHDNDWSISGYKLIMSNINCIEHVKSLIDAINENIVRSCMLFVMRHNVLPIWEDPFNKDGGCFSYKISNKYVYNVWNELFKLLCGESLCDEEFIKHINGITISPKKNFCVIKIWLDTIELQDPTIITEIINLNTEGCIFKKHEPEN